MRTYPEITEGKCTHCGKEGQKLTCIVFDMDNQLLIVCPMCLELVKLVMEILDIKEAEA